MKKIFISIVALVCASFAANAQMAEIDQDLQPFTNIDVCKSFDVSIQYGANYNAKISVSEIVGDYVQVYVKGKTLYVSLDEKSYPKELKKQLSGKKAVQPTLKLVVSAPTINSIVLHDSASLFATEILLSDALEMKLLDNSSVKNLAMEVQDFKLDMNKKATARLDVKTNNCAISLDASSVASMALNASSLDINTSNSSQLTANGEMKTVNAKTAGSSNVTLTGNASKLSLEGKNSSYVHADGLVVSDADIVLNGSTCEVNAKDNLKVELESGAKLIFNGGPVINVTAIEKSTMIRKGDSKRK
ncbi:MAG: DUF2807 domain-containing protein [Bacteroidales bacterium]|nr:DUF2807 domain-containing protein [Bacteroidales bacterium]